MKKIGILFGQERTFPHAFVERINSKNVDGIKAEPVRIDKVMQGERFLPMEYQTKPTAMRSAAATSTAQ